MVIMKKEPLFGILLEREMYDKYNIFKFHDIIKVYKTKDDRFIDDSGNKFYSYEDSAVINKQEKFFIGETINLDMVEEDFRYDILITGETLYARDEIEFWEYKFRAYSDYLELSEDRRIIVDKLKEGGTLYGK